MLTIGRQAFRIALVAAVAASMAACASKPRTAADASAGGPGGPGAYGDPNAAPTGQVGSNTLAPTPGSPEDFAITAGERVFFDTDEYTIRADARPTLDAQAAWLARYPSTRLIIEGNADERGTREYNLALGARRANAVRDTLVSRGVAASRIETVSYGKERPLDPGSSDSAHARNRNAKTALTSGSMAGRVAGRVN